ncbi:adenylyl-sulfate kinase [Trichlorobacter lovleyi]|uniref:adenylyl-sulfate kinase n=1 Tax=Trichlorobacter lovleyi TaxID=313985 RepID=UPI0003122F7D|nr:adenylyl-sulfate kinase [Trichlorobacter lovleyi]
MIIWIIGLPNAGKTTVAWALKERLQNVGHAAVILDGDAMRVVLGMETSHYDLKSRTENALRIGRLAAMLADQGIIIIVAANTAIREVQEYHRQTLPGYFEVYLKSDEATRRRRDQTKQLYTRYDLGEISNVLGLDIPAEEPTAPELCIDVSDGVTSVQDTIELILQQLVPRLVQLAKPTAS